MRLTRWNKPTAPSIETLRQALIGEGFVISEWFDPAGTIYPVHVHEYPEARVVVRGYLRVGLPETGEELVLGPGDRLDLPANTPHWADVNATRPVIYLSAVKNGRNGHKMR
jgi:quercetin dioxygenase-like cupin family protein